MGCSTTGREVGGEAARATNGKGGGSLSGDSECDSRVALSMNLANSCAQWLARGEKTMAKRPLKSAGPLEKLLLILLCVLGGAVLAVFFVLSEVGRSRGRRWDNENTKVVVLSIVAAGAVGGGIVGCWAVWKAGRGPDG